MHFQPGQDGRCTNSAYNSALYSAYHFVWNLKNMHGMALVIQNVVKINMQEEMLISIIA